MLSIRVQQELTTREIRRVLKSAIAGALVLSLLCASILALSPTLHQYFHHHPGGDDDYLCAVTLLKHGQVLAEGARLAVLGFVLLVLFCLPLALKPTVSFVDLRLQFGRAPPVFFNLQ